MEELKEPTVKLYHVVMGVNIFGFLLCGTVLLTGESKYTGWTTFIMVTHATWICLARYINGKYNAKPTP